MNLNFLKTYKDYRKEKVEKAIMEAEKEVRAEAAEKVTLREVCYTKNGEKQNLVAICFEGSVIFLAEKGDPSITDKLLQVREYYTELWSPRHLLEMR